MIEIYTDACIDDNTIRTNLGGNGFIIVDPVADCILHTYIEPCVNSTVPREELKAIINSLDYIVEQGLYNEEIVLYSDSMYCVNGANGVWKIKKNIDLWGKFFQLFDKIKNIDIRWIKSHQKEENYNTIIDELINERLNLNPKF